MKYYLSVITLGAIAIFSSYQAVKYYRLYNETQSAFNQSIELADRALNAVTVIDNLMTDYTEDLKFSNVELVLKLEAEKKKGPKIIYLENPRPTPVFSCKSN